jgi:hypothetical protein
LSLGVAAEVVGRDRVVERDEAMRALHDATSRL